LVCPTPVPEPIPVASKTKPTSSEAEILCNLYILRKKMKTIIIK
jgi:hypothetical protein